MCLLVWTWEDWWLETTLSCRIVARRVVSIMVKCRQGGMTFPSFIARVGSTEIRVEISSSVPEKDMRAPLCATDRPPSNAIFFSGSLQSQV